MDSETITSKKEFALAVEHNLYKLYNFVRREIAFFAARGELTQVIRPEEIVGEATLHALQHLERRPRQISLYAWLCKLSLQALRRQTKLMREQPRERSLFETIRKEAGPDREGNLTLMDIIPDKSSPIPHLEAEEHELIERIYQILGEGPETRRRAFILRDIEGFPYDEVGGILAISVESARREVKAARKFLREKLSQEDLALAQEATPKLKSLSEEASVERG